jgi:thiol-disulfide isomerase/thioredoxin
MKSLKERIKRYKNKSVLSKITDLIFIAFLVALFIPGSRLAIGGFVNRVKSMVVQPSEIKESKEQFLSEEDYSWKLSDMIGNEITLSDHKNKVLFINFWATWCPPCVGEMPEIQKLYDTFKDNSQIEFLLVTNETIPIVQKFLDKRSYNFPIYISEYRAPEILSSNSIPTTFIISKKGVIKVKEKGAQNWSGDKTVSIINNLLKE